MIYSLILIWCLLGLIGGSLLRLDWIYSFPEDGPFFCLSPYQYTIYIPLCSLAGLPMFFCGLLIYLIEFGKRKIPNWFFRPICKGNK